MLVDRLQTHPDSEIAAPPEKATKRAGRTMAEHFLSQPKSDRTLLLDMDGVVMQGDSLHEPRVTNPHMIHALQRLEKLGIKIGCATGRSEHIVRFLRSQGLRLEGPAILEEGQTLIHNGVTEYLGHDNHRKFMKSINAAMTTHPEYSERWDKVRRNYSFAFCPGNEQWQGDCRSSFWFHYDKDSDPKYDAMIVAKLFAPRLQKIAEFYELTPDDLALSVYRMKPNENNGNLAIIGLKGRLKGEVINKATAAQKIKGSPVFVADGFGDMPLAEEIKRRGGPVIGIKGNLDESNEPNAFLDLVGSKNVLENPSDFVTALYHTADILDKNEAISTTPSPSNA